MSDNRSEGVMPWLMIGGGVATVVTTLVVGADARGDEFAGASFEPPVDTDLTEADMEVIRDFIGYQDEPGVPSLDELQSAFIEAGQLENERALLVTEAEVLRGEKSVLFAPGLEQFNAEQQEQLLVAIEAEIERINARLAEINAMIPNTAPIEQ